MSETWKEWEESGNKKVCEHHKLDLTRASTKNIGVIICIDCKKTWHYNDVLMVWSDTFVGKFKELDEIRSIRRKQRKLYKCKEVK
jgi:hypothetical protein